MAEIAKVTPSSGKGWKIFGIIIAILFVIGIILFFIFGNKASATQVKKPVVPNPTPNPNGGGSGGNSTWNDIVDTLWNFGKDLFTSKPKDELPKGYTKDCCGNVFDETGACFGVCFTCDPATDC